MQHRLIYRLNIYLRYFCKSFKEESVNRYFALIFSLCN